MTFSQLKQTVIVICTLLILVPRAEAAPPANGAIGAPPGYEKYDWGLNSEKHYPMTVSEWRTYWTVVSREKWTGNEAQYRQARRQIEDIVNKKELTLDGLKKYELEAYRAPQDPLARYRWGLFAYWYKYQKPKKMSLTGRVAQALFNGESGRTYEYARLRFLIAVANDNSNPEGAVVGERLLRHVPKDYWVQYYTIQMLSLSKDPKAIQKGIAMGKDFVAEHPRNSNALHILAQCYHAYFYYMKQPAYAQLAIATYRRQLAILPKDSVDRRYPEDMIEMIQRKLKGNPHFKK